MRHTLRVSDMHNSHTSRAHMGGGRARRSLGVRARAMCTSERGHTHIRLLRRTHPGHKQRRARRRPRGCALGVARGAPPEAAAARAEERHGQQRGHEQAKAGLGRFAAAVTPGAAARQRRGGARGAGHARVRGPRESERDGRAPARRIEHVAVVALGGRGRAQKAVAEHAQQREPVEQVRTHGRAERNAPRDERAARRRAGVQGSRRGAARPRRHRRQQLRGRRSDSQKSRTGARKWGMPKTSQCRAHACTRGIHSPRRLRACRGAHGQECGRANGKCAHLKQRPRGGHGARERRPGAGRRRGGVGGLRCARERVKQLHAHAHQTQERAARHRGRRHGACGPRLAASAAAAAATATTATTGAAASNNEHPEALLHQCCRLQRPRRHRGHGGRGCEPRGTRVLGRPRAPRCRRRTLCECACCRTAGRARARRARAMRAPPMRPARREGAAAAAAPRRAGGGPAPRWPWPSARAAAARRGRAAETLRPWTRTRWSRRRCPATAPAAPPQTPRASRHATACTRTRTRPPTPPTHTRPRFAYGGGHRPQNAPAACHSLQPEREAGGAARAGPLLPFPRRALKQRGAPIAAAAVSGHTEHLCVRAHA